MAGHEDGQRVGGNGVGHCPDGTGRADAQGCLGVGDVFAERYLQELAPHGFLKLCAYEEQGQAESLSAGSEIFVELEHGFLYCFRCAFFEACVQLSF